MSRFRRQVITIFFAGLLWPGTSIPRVSAQASPTLSPAELQGKKVFLQRCSICHLPPLYEPPSVKPYGPTLDGYVRNSQTEERARRAIREGTMRMPSFQYGLQQFEIDNVISYLKTLKTTGDEGGTSNAGKERIGD